MSYYYHNYLICNNRAKNRITSLSVDDFDDQTGLTGYYDEYILEVNSDCFLVIFNTRGHEYCDSFIRRFVSEYKNTIWFCVDEVETNQICYRYEGDIIKTSRNRYFPSSDDYINIDFKDGENYRPLLSYYLSDEKLAVDNVLANESKEYDLTKEESEITRDFIRLFVNINSDDEFKSCYIPKVEKFDIQVYANYRSEESELNFVILDCGETPNGYKPKINTYENLIGFVNEMLKERNADDLIPLETQLLNKICSHIENVEVK